MESNAVAAAPPRRALVAGLAGTIAFLVVFAAALDWAKWTPYLQKLQHVARTRAWPGHRLARLPRRPPDRRCARGAHPAPLAPPRAAPTRRLAGLPTLMCTCCAAPITANLRRSVARTVSVLAYWLANPVLNPAVLAFLALVAPWQWVVTRIFAGVVLVFGVSVVVAKLTADDGADVATILAVLS